MKSDDRYDFIDTQTLNVGQNLNIPHFKTVSTFTSSHDKIIACFAKYVHVCTHNYGVFHANSYKCASPAVLPINIISRNVFQQATKKHT